MRPQPIDLGLAVENSDFTSCWGNERNGDNNASSQQTVRWHRTEELEIVACWPTCKVVRFKLYHAPIPRMRKVSSRQGATTRALVG